MSVTAPYLYDAFGLIIASDFPLHELRAAAPSALPDLKILDHSIGRPMPSRGDGVVMDYSDPAGVVMAWPEVAGFRIVDNATIWAEKPAESSDRMLAFPLLGPVMAWLLNARGMFVLHASAVKIGDRTIAFLGDKLAGKSTTAGAFIQAGHSLVTDDLLAIIMEPGEPPRCVPAFPQLKLEDKAAEHITIEGADAQPLVLDGFPKRQHKLRGMETASTSIDCLVRLDRGGEKPVFTPLSTTEAARMIGRFSYLPRFSKAPWTKADNHRHFSQCVTLADRGQVGALQVPDDLTKLDQCVAYVTDILDQSSQ